MPDRAPTVTSPTTPRDHRGPLRSSLRRAAACTAALLALAGCARDPATTVEETTRPADAPKAAGAGQAEGDTSAGPHTSNQKNRDPGRANPPAAGTALEALAQLEVKGRAPMTGYDRDQFGPAWLDTDRNGCDTRNDILAQHLANLVIEAGTHGCVVLRGSYADPYTGTRIAFVRGDGFLLDIDHVVALGNAWSGGAARWEARKRGAFANDPLNLLPADASANRAKGDADASTWLPPNKGYRCAYVARQVAVKAKYGLPVTPAEHHAIARVLGTCPGQRLPADSGAPVLAPVRVVIPDRTPPTQAPDPNHTGGTGTVYYENCDAARAADAAPVYRGDPGYGTHLDRDGDGAACE
jgi:hypothetical protein